MYSSDGSEKVVVEGSASNTPVPISVLPTQALLTTTLLGASGVYTSVAMDTQSTGNTEINVTALSSVGASATNGFVLQTSEDATNWTVNSTATVATGTPGILTTAIYQRYWRVVYTNGATVQTGTFSIYATVDTGFVPLLRPNTVHAGVSVPVYLVSGTNAIGNIGSINSALPAGTNAIGKTTSTNDATTNYSYSAAATTVVKSSAGRLVSVLVTGTVGTANVNIYDNASAASGTIIGLVPSGTAIGTVLIFAAPATLGITIGGVSGNANFTVNYA